MDSPIIPPAEKSKILLVIPFYNEVARISKEEFMTAFRQHPHFHFLLTDDGSKDQTAVILKDLESAFSNVTALIGSENSGKAATIRNAVLFEKNNTYDYVGYIDADLSTAVSEFNNIATFAANNRQFSFVMGSRIKKFGSHIERYAYRHYIGRIFATVISSLILKKPVYDTQCGAKIIQYDLALALFSEPFQTKWFFDLELLLRFQRQQPDFDQQVFEYSLNRWIEKGKSKITFADMVGFPFQLIKIYFKYDCYR